MPLLWDHGLRAGDEIGGSLFPQVLPERIAAEGLRRDEGPELPDPSILNRVAESMAASQARS